MKTYKDTPDHVLVKQHPRWDWAAQIIVFLYSFATGFQTAGVLILMGVLTGPFLLYVAAPIIFIATVFLSWRACHVAVPAFLIRLACQNIDRKDNAFSGLSPIPWKEKQRKRWLEYAMVGAFAMSLVVGALTVQGAVSTLAAFSSLAFLSAFFYPIALFFGATVFICLGFLMLRSLRKLIKQWDGQHYLSKVKKFFHTFRYSVYFERFKYRYETDQAGNRIVKGLRKPIWVKLEYGVSVFLWLLFIPLTLLGLGVGLWICGQQFSTLLLMGFPQLSHAIVGAISFVLSMIIAYIVQIPFYIEAATKAAINFMGLFEYSRADQKTTFTSAFSRGLVFIGRIIVGIANAVISAHVLIKNFIFAVFGGAGAAVSNMVMSEDNEEKKTGRFNDWVNEIVLPKHEAPSLCELPTAARETNWKTVGEPPHETPVPPDQMKYS